MNRELGFSLVELLVVLAVVAFLAFVTAPLASGWIRNAQLEKDFAGVQRALGTTKALAMRNSQGMAAGENPAPNTAFPAASIAAALCRKGDGIYVASAPTTPLNCSGSDWNNKDKGAKPLYQMGQDVSITFGNNTAFCGALFDVRGRVRLCSGDPCTTCNSSFDPTTGINLVVKGADVFKDPAAADKETAKSDPKDQTNIIRAF